MTFTVMVDVLGVRADSSEDAIEQVQIVLLAKGWDANFFATKETARS
jgi:hypothetical protein